jgi:hypothetical protein
MAADAPVVGDFLGRLLRMEVPSLQLTSELEKRLLRGKTYGDINPSSE